VVAAAAMLNGASPVVVATSFETLLESHHLYDADGDGRHQRLVVASSPPAAKLIDGLAGWPRSGRGAVAFVAAISMLTSLLNWGMSLIFSGLLVRALARRNGLHMDYRAAGAAAYLGLGATWALGLSSSAAQLQANAASLPRPLLQIHGSHPVRPDDLPVAILDDRCCSDRHFDVALVLSAPPSRRP